MKILYTFIVPWFHDHHKRKMLSLNEITNVDVLSYIMLKKGERGEPTMKTMLSLIISNLITTKQTN